MTQRERRSGDDRFEPDGASLIDLTPQRHATASWLIDSGANPLEVAERLRHSRVTTTLSVYGHLFEGVDARLDELLEATRATAVANEPRPVRGLAGA